MAGLITGAFSVGGELAIASPPQAAAEGAKLRERDCTLPKAPATASS